MSDKRNYSLEKCEKIRQKINELQEKRMEIREKWFRD
jgi:hypothetical protein